MFIYLLPLLTIPLLPHVLQSSQGTPTNNLQVNLAINYGNGTAVWYNGTSVPIDSNFFNVTTLVTNNNTGAIFFASFGSHFVYSINGVGCPASNPFCDVAWSFWTLDGICWDPAQVGVDQVSISQATTAGWTLTTVNEFGQVPPTGQTCLDASIDVKPGNSQNTISLSSRGSIPVAILTTSTLNARTVNPSTFRFGRTGTEAAPTQWALEDVNGDGKLDLVLHFNTQATGFQAGDAQAILMGRTLNGTPFRGTDTINTILHN